MLSFVLKGEEILTNDAMIIVAFVFYIGLMMGIGVYYYRQTKNMSDYFLGNRRLGAWVTSLSAEASDMSGWMLMGVPGFAYLAGLNAGWIAVGIALGTWANWQFVAARLRRCADFAGISAEPFQGRIKPAANRTGDFHTDIFYFVHVERICVGGQTF